MKKTVSFSQEYQGLTEPFRELELDYDLLDSDALTEILDRYYAESADMYRNEALFPCGTTIFKLLIAERASGGAAECGDLRRMKLRDGQKLSQAIDAYIESVTFDRTTGAMRWEDGELTLDFEDLTTDDLIDAEHTAGGNIKGIARLYNLRYLFAVAATAAGMKLDELLKLPFNVVVTIMEQTRLFFILGASETPGPKPQENSEETA